MSSFILPLGLITRLLNGALFFLRRRSTLKQSLNVDRSRVGLSQFSAQDILCSDVRNVTGDYVEIRNIYAPPQPVSLSRVTLPRRRQFVGRDDIMTRIEQALKQDHDDVISLTGIAGVGKSALALEAAHRFANLFPDGRYWLDLRSNDATKALRDLLNQLGVTNPEQLRGDVMALAEIVRGQLAGKRVLLILDNAEGIAQHRRHELLAMCPPPPAKTIITSRFIIDTNDIRVDVLSDEDALALLSAKHVDVASQYDNALKLARRLGNLALALEIVARRMCITKPMQSCASSLREIEESNNLVDALKLPLSRAPDDNVACAFAISYDLLDQALRGTFHALGVCAPSGASIEGVARICDISEANARDHIRALAMLSLVEFDGARAKLHPLLHDYAYHRAQANTEEFTTLILRHAVYFGGDIGSSYQQALNEERDSLPALMKIDAELDNVRLAQERVLSPDFPSPELAVEITDYLTLYWRCRCTDIAQLLGWLTRARQLAHKTQQQNSEANLLQAIGDLQAFQDQRDAALASYAEALQLFVAVGDVLGEANALKAIGNVQSFRKECDAALASYERALDIFTKIGDRLGRANTLKAIGDVYAFRKACDAALTSYERAMDIFTIVGDRLSQANTLQAIGDVQSFRDKYDEALASYRWALDTFTAVGDRLGQANALQAIGDIQLLRDERDAALASYERALHLFRTIGDRLGQANALKAIGDIQSFRKDIPAALNLYHQALALYAAVGSELGQANVSKAIGDAQAFQDDYSAALASYGRALALYTSIGSAFGQANVLRAIGDVRLLQREADAALTAYERALNVFTEVEDRLGQAHALKAIGDTHTLQGEYEAALASYEQACSLFASLGSKLGQAHALQAIGDLKANADETEEARTYLMRALELFTAAGSTLGQANVYLSLGNLNGNSDFFDRAIELYTDIQDEYSLARARFHYALSLLARDDKQAKALLTAARAGWSRIHFNDGLRAIDDVLRQFSETQQDLN